MSHRNYYFFGMGLVFLSFFGGIKMRSATHEKAFNDGQGKFAISQERGALGTVKHRERLVDEIDQTTYWLRWVAKAEQASIDEFPSLIAAAKSDENAYRLVMDEWLRRDPQHLLQSFGEARSEDDGYFGWGDWRHPEQLPLHKIGDYLLRNWFHPNPDAAIPVLSGLGSSNHLIPLQRAALKHLSKTGYKEVFKKAVEWKATSSHLPQKELLEAFLKKPEDVMGAYLNFEDEQKNWTPRGTRYGATNSILKNFAKTWAYTAPEDAMNFHSHSPEIALVKQVAFETWTQSDYDAASYWLGKQNDLKLQDQLRPVLIDSWSRDDPEAAHEWCREHLTGERYRTSLKAVVNGAIEVDPDTAIALIDGMEADESQTEAAKFAMSLLISDRNDPFGSENIDQDKMKRGVEWIISLEDSTLLSSILEIHASSWAREDDEGAIAFLSDEKNANLSDASFVDAAVGIAEKNPEKALQWAGEFEGDRGDLMAVGVFERWLSIQQGEALEWFREISPDVSLRRQLVEKMAKRAFFPGSHKHLFRDLTSGERDIARESIRANYYSDEEKARALKLLK